MLSATRQFGPTRLKAILRPPAFPFRFSQCQPLCGALPFHVGETFSLAACPFDLGPFMVILPELSSALPSSAFGLAAPSAAAPRRLQDSRWAQRPLEEGRFLQAGPGSQT